MASWIQCALLLCLADTAIAARAKLGSLHQDLQNDQLSKSSGGEAAALQCCCKEGACSEEAESGSGQAAVYSPAHGLCCKFKHSCTHYWGYSMKAESTDFCFTPQDVHYEEPELPGELPSALKPDGEDSKYDGWAPEPNTPAHTVDSFCDMQGYSAVEARDVESTVNRDLAAAAAKKQRRDAVISDLVKELSKSSVDSMARDLFSIYVCVRWAPNEEFTRLAADEIETEQLPKDADPYDLYADGSFIPLRCSRNVNVYDAQRSTNETHFQYFEKALLSIAGWLEAEQKGEVKKRLLEAEVSPGEALRDSAKAFDLAPLASFVAQCPEEVDSRSSVHVRTASVEELVSNCAAARWWLGKLRDWHTAFPFVSFMAPAKDAAVRAPKQHEQVLVCFGRRVASQLHRRAGGSHLLADQSAVGCHGFWSFRQSASMLRRTVGLWRPPTCRLAGMELEMKLKLLDAVADMNTQLFDALPAMVLNEQAKQPELEDGSALTPAGAAGTLGRLASDAAGAVGWLAGLSKAYRRMGLLLGNTVVKWAVCPLRPLADQREERQLDGVLNTGGGVERLWADAAVSRYGGEGNTLPGEVCRAAEDSPVPRCSECRLGTLQESMPEPYGDDPFVCPVRPLLPAREQLEVMAGKRGSCFMHMTAAQWRERGWIYRGHTPHRKQYDLAENPPAGAYESVKVVSWRRAPDAHFGLWRDFVTYARRCTEEESAATPRWCQAPAVGGGPTGGAEAPGGGLAAGVTEVLHKGLELTGRVQETPPLNGAIRKRLMNWVYGVAKKAEGEAKGLHAALLGRARGRQERLYARLFAEVEAGELLHSASFQRELKGAEGPLRYDRYAVACPCPDFDPDREFRLKFTWSEHALILASKGARTLPSSILTGAPALFVELQGASVLRMHDKGNAWQEGSTLLRAGGLGGGPSFWYSTRDPLVSSIVGVDPSSMHDDTIYGLRATYACGTRKAMHDLPLGLSDGGAASAPFAKCARDGAAKNKQLREASPGAPFLAEETVVRVTFAPLDTCYHEQLKIKHFAAPVAEGSSEAASAPEPAAEEEETFGEADNSVYKAFRALGQGCEGLSEDLKGQLPKELRQSSVGSTYRGVFIAKGLPEETLLEVLLDPADVAEELDLP